MCKQSIYFAVIFALQVIGVFRWSQIDPEIREPESIEVLSRAQDKLDRGDASEFAIALNATRRTIRVAGGEAAYNGCLNVLTGLVAGIALASSRKSNRPPMETDQKGATPQ
jgi:hypothetical protein